MARNGARNYEHVESEQARQWRLLRAQQDAKRNLARMGDAPRALMPLPPTNIEYRREAANAQRAAAWRDIMKPLEIVLEPYDEALAARMRVSLLAETDCILPRIICKRSGIVIGVCLPEQWQAMQAIWPMVTLEQAESMIAACGPIAPQALFSQPSALQALAAIDPIASAVMALERALGASWTGVEKRKRHERMAADLADDMAGDDPSLALIVFELSLDLQRLHADWHALDCVKRVVPSIILATEVSELIELLKDACTSVAQFLVRSPDGILGVSDERRTELFSKHGASYARKTKPVIGEPALVRRAISMYCRDYSFLLQQLSDDDILAIVGNAYKFRDNAMASYSKGKPFTHAGLAKALAAANTRESARQFEELMLDAFSADDPMPPAAPVRSIAELTKEAAERTKAQAQALRDKLRNNPQQ